MGGIIDTRTWFRVRVSFTLVCNENDADKLLRADHLDGTIRVEGKTLFQAGKTIRSVYQTPDKYTYSGVAEFTAVKSNIDKNVGLFVDFIRNMGGTAQIIL